MTNLTAAHGALSPLLAPDGRYDRSAVMADAYRQYRQMKAHGWSWTRCLSYSWARARVMRDRVQAVDDNKVRLVLARPTVEDVGLMFEAITGKTVGPEELAPRPRRRGATQAPDQPLGPPPRSSVQAIPRDPAGRFWTQ